MDITKIKNPYMYVGLVMTTPNIEKSHHEQIEQIVSAVASFYKLKPEDIVKKDRRCMFLEARQVAMYLASTAGLKSEFIGNHFRKDHSTVLYSKKIIQSKRDTDISISIKIQQILLSMSSERDPQRTPD